MYSTVGKDDWRPLLGSNFREQYGAFSPDGKWVAYQSNETGAPGDLGHRLSRRQTETSNLRARRPRAAVEGGRDRAVLRGRRRHVDGCCHRTRFRIRAIRSVVSRGSFSGERRLALRGDQRRAEVPRAGRTARPVADAACRVQLAADSPHTQIARQFGHGATVRRKRQRRRSIQRHRTIRTNRIVLICCWPCAGTAGRTNVPLRPLARR